MSIEDLRELRDTKDLMLDDSSGKVIPIGSIHINELLGVTIEKGASDLHISVHLPPIIRVDSEGNIAGGP